MTLETPFSIPGKIDGVPTKVLQDTGASISVIAESFLQRLRVSRPNKHYQVKKTDTVVRAANWGKLDVIGEVTLNIKMGRARLSCDMLVIRDFPYDALIGLDNMKKHGIIVDPANNYISIKGHPILKSNRGRKE